MNENLIKVLNQDKAQTLIDLGFKYIKETMNQKTVHSFFVSEDLVKYVNQNFDKHDFLLTSKMTF